MTTLLAKGMGRHVARLEELDRTRSRLGLAYLGAHLCDRNRVLGVVRRVVDGGRTVQALANEPIGGRALDRRVRERRA